MQAWKRKEEIQTRTTRAGVGGSGEGVLEATSEFIIRRGCSPNLDERDGLLKKKNFHNAHRCSRFTFHEAIKSSAGV